MSEIPQIPYRRDYLLEAIKIAEGGAVKNIKREHLKALYDAYTAVCGQHSALKNKLKQIANQALKLRAVNGLSTTPPKENNDNGSP